MIIDKYVIAVSNLNSNPDFIGPVDDSSFRDDRVYVSGLRINGCDRKTHRSFYLNKYPIGNGPSLIPEFTTNPRDALTFDGFGAQIVSFAFDALRGSTSRIVSVSELDKVSE